RSRQGRDSDGLRACARADAIEQASGGDGDCFVNLAIALRDEGRSKEPLKILERNLAEKPSPRGYFTYAGLLLQAARMREGWRYYEYRWTDEPLSFERMRVSPRPYWNGQGLRGHTILLHSEQGY